MYIGDMNVHIYIYIYMLHIFARRSYAQQQRVIPSQVAYKVKQLMWMLTAAEQYRPEVVHGGEEILLLGSGFWPRPERLNFFFQSGRPVLALDACSSQFGEANVCMHSPARLVAWDLAASSATSCNCSVVGCLNNRSIAPFLAQHLGRPFWDR